MMPETKGNPKRHDEDPAAGPSEQGAGSHGEPGEDAVREDEPKWPGGGKKGEDEREGD